MSPTPKINLSAMVKKKETEKTPEPKIKDIEVKTEKVETTVNTEVATENVGTEVQTEVEAEKVEANSETKVEKTTEENTEKKEVTHSLMPKISLSSIKTTKSVTEIKEETQKNQEEMHKEKKEELLEVLDLETSSINDTTNKNENSLNNNKSENILVENIITENNTEKVETNNAHEESLEEIEKKINEKVEEEVNKKLKKSPNTESGENTEVIDDKKELFGNYKSEFIEKEDNIIEKVETEKKKFSDRLREPKTRILLVVSLILITIGIIGTLFKIDPENHSIGKYKSEITKNIKNIKNNYIEKPWVLEVTNIDGYSFNTYTQKKIFGGSNYKYNEVVYKSKSDLDQVINSELALIKQDAERKRMEEENKTAEKSRLDSERLRVENNKITKEKIKTILLDKYKNLIQNYQ